SVAEIERVYQRVVPNLSAGLQNIVGEFGQKTFLGLKVWQMLGLLIVGALCFLLLRVLMWFFTLITKRLLPKLDKLSEINLKLLNPVTSPLSWYLISWLLREVFIPALILPINFSKYLILVIEIVAPILGVIVFYKLIDFLADIFDKLADRTETTMDDQIVPLVVRAAKLVVLVFGVIFVLQNLDVNVTALLAGVSIGGLAVALAAQETVKNFIGSLTIFTDRPFVVGDFIDTGSFMGVVVEVGVRSSRIRALDGAQITVPNGKLVDMTITNHGVRTYRRYATTLGLTYDTPFDKMEAFVNKAREVAQAHPITQEDSVTVQFHEMANSSLNIFFAAIYETTDHGEWLKARQEVFLAVMKVAEDIGVSFAFPSTSVYIESMPEQGTSEA
ncbi:MAG: mechanosensitive ion channel family protein, partial [Bacteroidota bacterium]